MELIILTWLLVLGGLLGLVPLLVLVLVLVHA